jgi:hypothetical protein
MTPPATSCLASAGEGGEGRRRGSGGLACRGSGRKRGEAAAGTRALTVRGGGGEKGGVGRDGGGGEEEWHSKGKHDAAGSGCGGQHPVAAGVVR